MWENNAIKEKLLATSQSRFRTDNNIHAIFLSCFINLYFNKAYLIQEKDYFFRLDSRNLGKNLNTIKEDKPTRFCINDGLVVNNKNLDVFHRVMQDLYLN